MLLAPITSAYYFWGFLSSALFLLAIPGILHQLRTIQRRKKQIAEGVLAELATQSISLNQIFSSYCAVYSFFLFGIASDTPDPFLTYPRAIVGCLLFLVVHEIYRERGSKAARSAFWGCCFSLLVATTLVITHFRSSSFVKGSSHIIICVTALLMAQGNISQWLIMKRSNRRGAVSLPMHLALYGKDFAGMMFGIQIGPTAWSIVLMHALNVILRAPIIWSYLRINSRIDH
jgi:hypothetical protein